MDIKKIPGGEDFRFSKFSSKFSAAAKYGNLRDSRDSVLKVIKASAGTIKSGKFDSRGALRKIEKMSDESLDWRQRRDVMRVLKNLEKGTSKKGAAVSALSAKAEAKAKVAEAESDRVKRAEILRRSRAYEDSKKLGSGEAASRIQTSALGKLKELDSKAAEEALKGPSQLGNTGLAGGGQSYGGGGPFSVRPY